MHDLTRLFEKLHATDEAAKNGELRSTHYRDVDTAMADVLKQLPPIHSAWSSSSGRDEAKTQETKQGHSTETAVDPASAMRLQALLAQHKGPRRRMAENEEALEILRGLFPVLQDDEVKEMLVAVDRREEMQAKFYTASSYEGELQPANEEVQQKFNAASFLFPFEKMHAKADTASISASSYEGGLDDEEMRAMFDTVTFFDEGGLEPAKKEMHAEFDTDSYLPIQVKNSRP